MNFASLLKHHENRQANSYLGNQFMINCNRKCDNQNIKIDSNYSGIKKNNIFEISTPKFIQIYLNFQDDSNTQWILQMENQKIKVHKFKPSKIKNKKIQQDFESHGQVKPASLSKQYVHINPIQVQQKNIQNLAQPLVTRKNYSPMQKLRPKTFGKQQNWVQNLGNQNKFSFGDDSEHPSQIQEQKNQHSEVGYQRQLFPSQNNQQIICQNGINLLNQFEKCSQKDAQKKNLLQLTKNQTLLKQYTPQLEQNRELTKNMINNEDQSNKKIVKCNEANRNSVIDFNLDVGFSFEEFDKIGLNNPIEKIEKEKQQVSINNIQQNNSTAIKMDKAISELDQYQVKQISPDYKLASHSNPQPNSQFKTELQVKEFKQTSLRQILQQTAIKVNQVNSPPKSEQKSHPPQQFLSNLKQEIQDKQKKQSYESSPHKIYCKANVRNLTPQKLKYPRIQSSQMKQASGLNKISELKINAENNQNQNEINKQCAENIIKINPLISQAQQIKILRTQSGICRTQNNILLERKLGKDNIESNEQISSSKKLQALIDESNQLLIQEKNHKLLQINTDRISRIVLHQPQNRYEKANTLTNKQSQGKSILIMKNQKAECKEQNIESKIDKYQQQTKGFNAKQNMTQSPGKNNQNKLQFQVKSTTPPKEFTKGNSTSPKSPIQQKPKFHNQLANMETTNHTSQTKNFIPKPSISNYVRFTEASNNSSQSGKTMAINLPGPSNLTIQNQNYFINQNATQKTISQNRYQNYAQSSYAYKPMGIPTSTTFTLNKPQHMQNNNPICIKNVQNNANAKGNQVNSAKDSVLQTNQHPAIHYPQSHGVTIKTYSPYFPLNNSNAKGGEQKSESIVHQAYKTYSTTPKIVLPQQKTQTFSNQNGQVLNSNFIMINQNYNYESGTLNQNSKLQQNPKLQQRHIYGDAMKSKQKAIPTSYLFERNLTLNKGFQGIKCVESRVYEHESQAGSQHYVAKTYGNINAGNANGNTDRNLNGNINLISNKEASLIDNEANLNSLPMNRYNNIVFHSDPKESSIQFSLRIDQHFTIN